MKTLCCRLPPPDRRAGVAGYWLPETGNWKPETLLRFALLLSVHLALYSAKHFFFHHSTLQQQSLFYLFYQDRSLISHLLLIQNRAWAFVPDMRLCYRDTLLL